MPGKEPEVNGHLVFIQTDGGLTISLLFYPGEWVANSDNTCIYTHATLLSVS